MSLTARNAQVYKGTAAVTYGSGSGVSNRELQGTATVTYGGAPTSNTALSLPGTSGNYMNLGSTNPANIDTSVSNVFVEAWFYAFSYPNSVAFIIYKGGNNINSEDFGLWVSGLYGVNWRLWNTAGAGFAGVTGSNNLNVNQWYHVAGSWDVGTKTIYTFLNGTLLGPGTLTGTPRYSASSRVQIGAANSAGFLGDYYPFNGYIQDVRIVQGGIVPKTSFTPARVPFRLNVPSYVTGGSTVLSLAEQYFTPTWLNLPGTSGSYATLTSRNPVNFDNRTSNLFCEAWVYLNSFQSVSTTIIGRQNTIASPAEDWMLWINSAAQPQFRIAGSGQSRDASLATVMTTGRWYHMAASWDATSSKIYVFLNGTASTNVNVPFAVGFNSSWETQVGFYSGGSGGQYVNGYVQDVRVTRGGIVPFASFTPAAAPFGLSVPSYVTGTGTTVLSLATQYYQTAATGLLPQVFLAPSGTYPSFTTTSAPVFSSSNVAFTGAGFSSGNFINFGQTTITMGLGYSIVFQFAWTGSFQSAYERIFDFGVAGGNSNAIIIFRNGTASTLNFGNFTGSSAQTVTSVSTFPQNTVSGTVVCIYDPASTGSLKMYVNGSLQATLNGITIIPNGSFPSSLIAKTNATGLDAFANVSIYSMKFYNRVLSAAEIARTASPISSVQFTNRTPLTPVLTNPGTLNLTIGQVITISQTAPQPANGITWTFGPTGTGLNLTSTTDYAMTLTVASGVISTLFTVTATNRAGLTTAIQFVAGGNLYPMTFPFTFTNMTATSNTGPTSITYGATNPGFGTGYAMVLGTGTTAGMQIWTVPASRTYTFTLAGAGSTASNSLDSIKTANGVIITGSTYALTAGQTVVILVGQQGLVNPNAPSGSTSGSGGTFVCLFSGGTYTPLFIAGGAGGIGNEAGTNLNVDASTGTAGRTPNSYVIGQAGGINGNGATGPTATGSGGTSGGGFFTAGTKGTNSGTAANGFLQGGEGGYGVIQGVNGGFGGGGGGGNQAGGGGGGYSGGAAGLRGSVGAGGAGGGSYSINGGFTGSVTNSGMGYVIISTPSNLFRTSLLASTPGNPLSIVVNSFNGFVYYVYGGTNSIFVMTTAGGAVTTVTPTAGYNIQAFGGGLAVNPATGIVYFQFLNGSQWGFGAIAPGTYSVTYNNTVSFSAASTGMYYLNGVIYWGRGTSVLQINVSTWAVSTYVTYGSGNIQGITAVGPDLYIMTINGSIFKNTSTTGLRSTQDYWGLASDGYYLYMGGAGTTGVYRTTVGNWSDRTQIITTGTYNLPGLIISMFYYNNAVYIAGYGNNAIILLST